MTAYRHLPLRVVVAGGGVAALETALALRAFAGNRVQVLMVAPNRYFAYRPIRVLDPLTVNGVARVPLARIVADDLRQDQVVSIDSRTHRVRTAGGFELDYDALVLAVGAVPQPVTPRAEPFNRAHAVGSRVLVRRALAGRISSLAFVEPCAPADALELYDLAVDTAVATRRRRLDVNLTFITAQDAPAAILGLRASTMVTETLLEHGLRIATSAHVRAIGYGEIELDPLQRTIGAQGVIAAPRFAGPRLAALPADRDGFLPVDLHGRVRGIDRVFAVGDCAAFPVKHPSLSSQQADAVAAMIAAEAGVPGDPKPFKPVVRCLLPSRLRWYVEAPLIGGQGDATQISAHPLWSSELRFGTRYLDSRIAELRVSTASAPTDATTMAIVVP